MKLRKKKLQNTSHFQQNLVLQIQTFFGRTLELGKRRCSRCIFL